MTDNTPTSWRLKEGKYRHEVFVSLDRVNLGSTYIGTNQGGGSHATHKEFLEGSLHETIKSIFGNHVLQQVLVAVLSQASSGETKHYHKKIGEWEQWFQSLPYRGRLEAAAHEAQQDGADIYGADEDGKTILRSDQYCYRADINTRKAEIVDNFGKAVGAPYFTYVVEMSDRFYGINDNDFLVIDRAGQTLTSANQNKKQVPPHSFGVDFRFSNVLLKKAGLLWLIVGTFILTSAS